MENVNMETVDRYSVWLWDLVMTHAPKVALALVTLIVGLWIIGIFNRQFRRVLEKREFDPSLTPFLRSLLSVTLKVLLGLSILGMLGVQVTSFIAILGAAGLAVGLALQGSLQNVAGGVVILIFRPFEVGHFIEAGGHSGTVKAIQIFNTILTTPDNKTIILPNGSISNSSMVNYSAQPTRRVDMTFGIGYGDSVAKAKEILMGQANADERVLKDPEPFVAVAALADSSVNLTLRVWCNSADYWPIFFDYQEQIKAKFDETGITIPFPQREVTMVSA